MEWGRFNSDGTVRTRLNCVIPGMRPISSFCVVDNNGSPYKNNGSPYKPLTDAGGDTAGTLLCRLAEDLNALLDCQWLIAWKKSGPSLTPICSIGDCPDRAACREETRRLLRAAVHHPFHRSGQEASAQVALFFPVREHGRIVGAITAGARR